MNRGSLLIEKRMYRTDLMAFSKKTIICLLGFYFVFAPPLFAKGSNSSLRLAVAPMIYNSGILSFLLPSFEKKNKLAVEIFAVNAESAFMLAEKGDVDALIVEDSNLEMSFMGNGFGADHRHFASNYYVILGPPSDPASIKGEKTAKYAFYKISEKKALFVSRGDGSEIDQKEKIVWESAYVKKKGEWYIETGRGMDETLMVADEQKGYTLCDKLTYAVMKDMVRLEILINEKDPYLKDIFNIIAVNPKRYPQVKYGTAMMLIDYLMSKEAQDIINKFKVNGEQLFYAGE